MNAFTPGLLTDKFAPRGEVPPESSQLAVPQQKICTILSVFKDPTAKILTYEP